MSVPNYVGSIAIKFLRVLFGVLYLRVKLWIAPMVGEEYSKPNYESLFYINRTTQKYAQASVWNVPIIVR